MMKRKIIGFIIWICITILYCLDLADTGRSMGANTNSAIEKYSEMMAEYGGTTTDIEHLGSALGDMSSYRMFNNLSEEFKFDFTVVAISTVVYVLASVFIYHFSFKEKKIKMN